MKEKRLSIFISVIFFAAFFSISHADRYGTEQETETEEGGGGNADILGPTADIMSDQGELFGDLYVILRYQGDEMKNVPAVSEDGKPEWEYADYITPDGETLTVKQQAWNTSSAVGGEPVLTENFVPYIIIDEDTGLPIPNPDSQSGSIWYAAPYASQCVQPVASYERWGDISAKTGLDKNLIPLSMVYDPTWDRTECEVGLQTIYPDGTIAVDPWFIGPGETWTDPVNGTVTYPEGVLWTDLVQEVSFGRMNVGRSPEAVLNASFDEAVRSINSAVAVEIDAAGRLLLTQEVFSELEVYPYTGEPVLLGTKKKAIDSPLENLALYVKLLSDGHLVTPGDERASLDRSESGGIPLTRMLELTDGPSDALRPTIDIDKLRKWGLGHLVDVTESVYYISFAVDYDTDSCIPISNTLYTLGSCDGIPATDECGQPVFCTGPFIGIMSDEGGSASGDDFRQAASFFAAAADKTRDVSVDMLVYLNSILGLNKVTGYSAYDMEGKPLPDAVNYAENPLYYTFQEISSYDRITYRNRGEVYDTGGNGLPSTYTGTVLVLQPRDGGWFAHETSILGDAYDPEAVNHVKWNAVLIGWDQENSQPTYSVGENNISGFAQMADDDLNVIEFIHTYQIPELR